MAFEVSGIFSRLGLDTSDFEKKLNSALTKLDSFARKARGKFESLGSSLALNLPDLSRQFAALDSAIKASSRLIAIGIPRAVDQAKASFASLGAFGQKQLQAINDAAKIQAGFQRLGVQGQAALAPTTLRQGFASTVQQSAVFKALLGNLGSLKTVGAGAASILSGLTGNLINLRGVAATAGSAVAAVGRVLSGAFAAGSVAVTGLVKSFNLLGRVARLVFSPFSALRNLLFNFRTLIFVIGIERILARAAQVDVITRSFDQLSRSVGALSDTFLGKLRKATRGTVSDFQLMRATNNAILLNVVKSEDQFAELAGAARRLGQAVGRDTVDAIDDLALGIGRQSRLILDNLGLIVRVEQANEAYAASLGKVSSQLTNAEEREAFLIAATEAIRKKLAELGPDVDTLADRFGRFKAAIGGAFNTIARALVGGGGALDAIARFLNRNQGAIFAFAGAVARSIGLAVEAIVAGARRVISGDLDIGTFVAKTVGTAFKILFSLVESGFRTFTPALLSLVSLLFEQVIALASARLTALFRRIQVASNRFVFQAAGEGGIFSALNLAAAKAARALSEAIIGGAITQEDAQRFEERLRPLEDLLARFSGKEDKPGQLIAAGFSEATDRAIDLEHEINAIVGDRRLQELKRDAPEAFRRAGQAFTSAIDRAIGKAGELSRESLDVLTGIEKGTSREAEAIVNRFRFERVDPLAQQGPLIVDRIVQPFATAFNKIVELRKQFFQRFGDFTVVPFTQEAVVRQSAALLQTFQSLIGVASRAAFEVRKFFVEPEADAEKFGEVVKRAEDEIRQIGIDIQTAGSTEGIKRVRELQAAFDALGATFSKIQKAKIERLRGDLLQFTELGAATNALADFERQLRQVGLTADQIAVQDINRSIQQILQSPDLDLEAKEATVNELIAKRAGIVRAAGAIAGGEFARSISDSVLNGIVDGLQRGERGAKIRAEILSEIFRNAFSKVISQLGDLVQQVFSKAFNSLNLGPGVTNLLTGAVAIGGLILTNIQSKRQATIDDFSRAIDSSEAIRGVVAGPTNVAISKVGENLKFALRTTEILLERIAVAVEGGIAPAAAARGGGGSFRLSAATPP